MQYITSTDLRTQSNELINTLMQGGSVTLIHRSKPVGIIQSIKASSESKVIDFDKIIQSVKQMGMPSLSDAEIDKKYRAAMIKKHGKHILGR